VREALLRNSSEAREGRGVSELRSDLKKFGWPGAGYVGIKEAEKRKRRGCKMGIGVFSREKSILLGGVQKLNNFASK